MQIEFFNGLEKGRGFEFSLFPVITISKTNWSRKKEYDVLIGIWFWGVELNWESTKL